MFSSLVKEALLVCSKKSKANMWFHLRSSWEVSPIRLKETGVLQSISTRMHLVSNGRLYLWETTHVFEALTDSVYTVYNDCHGLTTYKKHRIRRILREIYQPSSVWFKNDGDSSQQVMSEGLELSTKKQNLYWRIPGNLAATNCNGYLNQHNVTNGSPILTLIDGWQFQYFVCFLLCVM